MAKSKLLQFVDKLAPISYYTSGRGTSGPGLTAVVTKNHKTGGFSIKAGAFVLADGGICIMDEFDKMTDNARVALHEAMEQQTISIAKATLEESVTPRGAANKIATGVFRGMLLRERLSPP